MKAGYQVHVTTWENDGDHYNTRIIDAASAKEALNIVALLNYVEKNFDQDDYNDQKAKDDFEELAIILGIVTDKEDAIDWIHEYVGTAYESSCLRVVELVKAFYVPEVKNLLG
jgi:hypothetical protein